VDPISTRETILAVLGAVWAIAAAWIALRRKGKSEEDARADKVTTDTTARWRELYEQKCSDHEKLKAACETSAEKLIRQIGDLRDELTTERIKSGGLQSDLRRCRQDLRSCRESHGLPDEEDGEEGGPKSPVPGRRPDGQEK
jgi:hypothetical protein